MATGPATPNFQSESVNSENVPKIFFRANRISEDQVPIFLSYVGGVTYDLLRNLLAPELSLDTTFMAL